MRQSSHRVRHPPSPFPEPDFIVDADFHRGGFGRSEPETRHRRREIAPRVCPDIFPRAPAERPFERSNPLTVLARHPTRRRHADRRRARRARSCGRRPPPRPSTGRRVPVADKARRAVTARAADSVEVSLTASRRPASLARRAAPLQSRLVPTLLPRLPVRRRRPGGRPRSDGGGVRRARRGRRTRLPGRVHRPNIQYALTALAKPTRRPARPARCSPGRPGIDAKKASPTPRPPTGTLNTFDGRKTENVNSFFNVLGGKGCALRG